MKYRALVSFTGLVSMAVGEVREISDLSISEPLLKAKYIEEAKEDAPAPVEENPKEAEAPKKETPKAKPKTKSPKKKESKK